MNLLMKVMKILGVQPMGVFVQAFDYFEMRMTADDLNNLFNACCKDTEEGRAIIMMPRAVWMYCTEVLSGVAVPLNEKSELPPLEEYKK